ncbi:MAG: hypothetical protein DWI67_05840 [Chloroflexi bacterium]|nr:MAG: hypothetical protein DWI67_05840 [Chloroflexota bacterium]
MEPAAPPIAPRRCAGRTGLQARPGERHLALRSSGSWGAARNWQSAARLKQKSAVRAAPPQPPG